MSGSRLRGHALGWLFLFILPLQTASPASAAERPGAQELLEVIEAQQRQLEAQQQQLETLKDALETQNQTLEALQLQLQALAVDDRPAALEADTVLAEADSGLPMTEVWRDTRIGPLLSNRDKHDRDNPTSSNVTYTETAASAMIPGTETQVAVHGLAEFQIFHDTVGLNNNRFDTAFIPVDGGPSQTKFSVNPSQLAASSVTRVTSGVLNTWLSLDMNGQLDRPEPRLRIAIAEYVNREAGYAWLGGQTYSTMMDLRAVPETLDFALPAGLWAQRQPLGRFTGAVGVKGSFEISTETPENVIYDEGTSKRTRWPDFSAAGTWLVDGTYFKHLRLAALVRDLQAEGADGTTDGTLGWAISGSTKVALPFLGARDNLKVTMHFGDGYGTQLKGGPIEGYYDLASSSLETVGIWSAYGGLQHFWSPKFRSNLVFGYVEADNPSFVDDDVFKSTSYLAADLIWSPFPTTALGIEYLWGQRENEDGESGTSNRLLLSSKILF